MQKLIQEQNTRNNRTSAYFAVGLVVVLVILSIAKVFAANWLVESSETLRSLDKRINQQAKENQTIAETLRQNTSLVKIAPVVSQLGFTQHPKISFILSEKNVALNPSSVSQAR